MLTPRILESTPHPQSVTPDPFIRDVPPNPRPR